MAYAQVWEGTPKYQPTPFRGVPEGEAPALESAISAKQNITAYCHQATMKQGLQVMTSQKGEEMAL